MSIARGESVNNRHDQHNCMIWDYDLKTITVDVLNAKATSRIISPTTVSQCVTIPSAVDNVRKRTAS